MRELTYEEKNLIRLAILFVIFIVVLYIVITLGYSPYSGAECTGYPPDPHMSPMTLTDMPSII